MKFTNKCGLTKLIKKKILSQDRVKVDVEDEKRKIVEPSGLANIFKKRTTSQSTITMLLRKKRRIIQTYKSQLIFIPMISLLTIVKDEEFIKILK